MHETAALAALSHSGCFEYLLILSPHADLHARIARVKQDFAETYKAPLAKNRAHVTLVKFVTSGHVEEKLVNRLQHVAMGTTPFKVELKDYGSFPSHTIFINVVTKLPVQNLVRDIKQAQGLMRAHKDFKPHFIDEPHLTISRKLKPWQYESGWLEYSHLHFTGRFIADSMLLLKRSLTGGAYQIVKRFEFQNLPVATKQGSLFGSLSSGGGTYV